MAYKTEAGAKRAANKNLNPVVARMGDGTYDWFPQGHPIGSTDHNGNFIKDSGAVIVARWNSWKKRWQEVNPY